MNALSFNFIEGGWQFAIAGGVDIAVSWATCFVTYAGVHVGSKLWKYFPRKMSIKIWKKITKKR